LPLLQTNRIPTLSILATLGFTLAFYSFGRWLFFDLLGIKLLAEIIAVSLILTFAVLKVASQKFKKLTYVENFVLFCFLLFALGDLVGRSDIFGAVEMLICFSFILVFTQINHQISQAIGKAIVLSSALVAFFAVVITVSVAAGMFEPTETSYLYSEIKDGKFDLQASNFHNLFGMVTEYSSFKYYGFEVWRLSSLTSEPARLSVYFLLPITIGFVLGGKYAACSSMIILTLPFTNSWSLFLPLIFGLLFFVAAKGHILTKQWKKIAVFAFLGVYVILFAYGQFVENFVIEKRYEAQISSTGDFFRGSSILKIQSILFLIIVSLQAFPMWISVPVVNGPLPFYLIAQGGVLTLPLALVGFSIIDIVTSNNFSGMRQYGYCLFLGVWTTSMFFTTAPFFITPAALICILVIFKITHPINSR